MKLSLNEMINLNLVHSIHTTQRRSFRGCRRRHNWIFVDGYYPTVTAKPLEFGIAYHKAMEVWYDPDMWGIDREVAIALARQTFVQECDKQKKTFLDNREEKTLDEETETDYQERKALGLGMLTEYVKTSMQLDTNFRPIFVEKKFEVPILGPAGEVIWCKCDRCWNRWKHSKEGVKHHDEWQESLGENNHTLTLGLNDHHYRYFVWKGLPVTYGGRVDMLAEDLMGRYWIYDWKTAMRLSTGEPNAPDDYLFLDDQISSYCWAFAMHLNIDVAGFIYHEQKKAFPVEPEPMKHARLGCMYSKNKQLDTDWQTYETTVRENDTYAYEQGYYDEFIQYLKDFGGVFHKRHQIARTYEELVNIGQNIYQEALDITDPNLRIYPSPGRFGCTFCAFQDPCLGMNRGLDYKWTLDTMFEKRVKHYYEDAEPSTDKPDRV